MEELKGKDTNPLVWLFKDPGEMGAAKGNVERIGLLVSGLHQEKTKEKHSKKFGLEKGDNSGQCSRIHTEKRGTSSWKKGTVPNIDSTATRGPKKTNYRGWVNPNISQPGGGNLGDGKKKDWGI